MPAEQCYRDIGALGARLDEIEKSRQEDARRLSRELHEREERQDRAIRERDTTRDAAFYELMQKMDKITAERNQLTGIIWAFRILFGAGVLGIGWAINGGLPGWIKDHVAR